MTGFEPVTPKRIDPTDTADADEVRHGRADGPADVLLLGGYFVFDSPDAALLVSLLPAVVHVHVRGVERLTVLVSLVADESLAQLAGRDLVLTRLVEILLIQALRLGPGDDAPPGLLRGLSDLPCEREVGVHAGQPRHDVVENCCSGRCVHDIAAHQLPDE